MYINTFLKTRSSGTHSIYSTGIVLLIVIIFSGCSLSLFGNEGNITSTQSTPTDNQSQNQTLAAGFSNIMTATVASTTQSTSDAQSGSGAVGMGTAVIPALTETSQSLPTMTPSKTSTPSTPGLVAPTTVHSSSITQVPK